jgi:(+)-trans-carveol dehydrogenase
MPGRLEGKVAFVTGAARGQGRSHAIRLAQEGADIIAIDICAPIDSVPYELATPDDLAETAKEVEALDRRIVATEADVRDFGAVKAALDTGVAEFGRLDVVSANAGIVSYGESADLEEQTWQDVIATNLTGAWHTAKASIPHIKAGGRGGAIILTSSAAGLIPYLNLSHYTASKHGVVGLMKSLALELAPDMIRVNTVNPTAVNTPMVNNQATYTLFSGGIENATLEDVAPALVDVNALPIKWVESVDVSNAVVFLASDEARYITGVALPVDAGVVIK